MYDPEFDCDCHYPRSNETWFPRQGYLDRATFDLTFRHNKRLKIASGGKRVSEEPDAENKDMMVTKYEMHQPVALITFALAPFQRHQQMVKFEAGASAIPFRWSLIRWPGRSLRSKKTSLWRSLTTRSDISLQFFGKYPYPTFGAAFHPFNFGQGFPTLVMIPRRIAPASTPTLSLRMKLLTSGGATSFPGALTAISG